jgi:hypothetical protein
MNWFWKLYEKLLPTVDKVDAKLAKNPVDKALTKGLDKVMGPLVK